MQEPRYLTKKIDEKWIKELELYSNNGLLKFPRSIRTTQVNKLLKLLENNEFWDTPFVINHIYDLKNKLINCHIIDGTHRIFALKRFYRDPKNKEKSFNQQFAVYENLTEEEERMVYTKWSVGVKQTLSDWIIVNQEIVNLWGKIRQDSNFPVKVSLQDHSRNVMLFEQIFYAYGLSLSSESKFNPRKPIFSELPSFNYFLNQKIEMNGHYDKLKNFLTFFYETFGDVGKDNIFQKNNLFYPILDIYMKNINLIKKESLKKNFQKIMGRKDILEVGRLYSCPKQKVEVRKKMIDIIAKNDGVKLK